MVIIKYKQWYKFDNKAAKEFYIRHALTMLELSDEYFDKVLEKYMSASLLCLDLRDEQLGTDSDNLILRYRTSADKPSTHIQGDTAYQEAIMYQVPKSHIEKGQGGPEIMNQMDKVNPLISKAYAYELDIIINNTTLLLQQICDANKKFVEIQKAIALLTSVGIEVADNVELTKLIDVVADVFTKADYVAIKKVLDETEFAMKEVNDRFFELTELYKLARTYEQQVSLLKQYRII